MDNEQPVNASDLSAEDRELGIDRPIERRDFLNGMAYTAATIAAQSMMPWGRAGAAANTPYPPTTANTIVGQTDKANAIMHSIRDGLLKPITGKSTGEVFDLVVVGAGISGLAAANEFRRLNPKAKVLLIDPLADVGGHAKRNEFTVGGKTLIGYGGSQSLQTPSYFSPAVNALLANVGIEPKKFEGYYDSHWYDKRGLGPGTYFDKAVYGHSATVKETDKAAGWVNKTPLNAQAKKDLIELTDAPKDYLPGSTAAQKRAMLSQTTYQEFLLKVAKVDPQLVTYFADSTREYYGSGIDIVGALDAAANGNPGLGGMGLGDQVDINMSPSGRLLDTDPDPYIYHFPDGNASVARAIVRSLIPQAVAKGDMVTLALSKMDYSQLDVQGHNVRIRLNSTAVKVRHLGDPKTAKQVEVTYADMQGFHSVVAGQVVLACWHRVIPYLTDEIPVTQVKALQDQVKVPLNLCQCCA